MPDFYEQLCHIGAERTTDTQTHGCGGCQIHTIYLLENSKVWSQGGSQCV